MPDEIDEAPWDPDGYALRTIVLPYPAVHDGWNHLTYAQEEKGLIFPIMTKGLQDNGVGVNAKWIPE